MGHNLLKMADSYKVSHSKLYPSDMTGMYSYLESRGGVFPANVFFGLQYYLDKYLVRGVDHEDIEDAKIFWDRHFGRPDVFDADAWHAMVDAHGYDLPVRIRAVPEGTVVPAGNVLMTIENTDGRFPFVTNFIETLLMKVWYPITVASQSYFIRRAIAAEYERSGAPMAGLVFACHDFGYRGVSSEETAAIGGAAHMTSFLGSDNAAGIEMTADYYEGDMAGFSIPATEHSTICSFGPGVEGERKAFQHLLDTFPTGIIACVSDTYDIYNAVEKLWGGEFRDQVLARDGVLVVRPDSGNPVEVTLRILRLLGKNFGVSKNAKGYLVLDPHVRVIYGDGMNRETIPALYKAIVDTGWSAENLVVGSGGGLLQDMTRDTNKFAIKASEAIFEDYRAMSISKNPITDSGKRSKTGRLKLIDSWGGLSTVTSSDHYFYDFEDKLERVFENGYITRHQTFDDIRARVDSSKF